jgi:hypothetical protein
MKVKARLITWTNDKQISQSKIKVKLNDGGRTIIARIDKVDMKFFLPLYESSLWKLPLYYEISTPMPMIGEPPVAYPKKYLVVEVR